MPLSPLRSPPRCSTLRRWSRTSSRDGSVATTGSPSRGGRRSLDRPRARPTCSLVVLDDVGFAQLGCFGSDIDTPNLDALAAGGLRYANFHTTALCSPTRACVLTGRNHHAVGMGRIVDLATGFPGYDARIPRSCALLPGDADAARLRGLRGRQVAPHPGGRGAPRRPARPVAARAGASSASTASSPARRTSSSRRWSTTTTTSSRRRACEDGYHLTTDLVDHAIEWIEDLRNVDVDKPWFLYLATGACHSPHQSPAEWIERYRGHFDQGWDAWREATLARQKAAGLLPEHTELSPRPDWVPAWADLSDDRAPRLRPLHGGLRRLPLPHRRPSSAGSSIGCASSASSTTRSWWSCPTTARRRRAARSARSTTSGSGTCCRAPSRRRPSGSTRSADRASTTTTRGAGRWPATPRSAAGSARRTRAAWPIR